MDPDSLSPKETDDDNKSLLFCFCGKCDLNALRVQGSDAGTGPLTSCFLNFSSNSQDRNDNHIMAPKEDTKSSTDEKQTPTHVGTPLKDFKFPEKTKEEQDEEVKYAYNPKSPLPLISLQQGLYKKATPWALSSWVKLALSLDGRDKITKLCQYSARMLAWWFVGTNQAKRFKSVQTSVTTSRKAFRLGRSFIEIQKIRDSGLLELFFTGSTTKSDPAWKIVGSALKMIGLMGFWAGDNVNFLTGSGLFDDYTVTDPTERMAKRGQLKTQASHFANRFYFFGCIAGLVTNLKAYFSFRTGALRQAHDRLADAAKRVAETDRTDENKNKELWGEAKDAMEKAREKQFSLFVALLKSCVDVIVFSNNAGIDLHKKFRGKKNHEGLHCLCGLTSAATVLYNNYPNAKK